MFLKAYIQEIKVSFSKIDEDDIARTINRVPILFFFRTTIQREYKEYLSWTTVHETSIFSYPCFRERGKKNPHQTKGGRKNRVKRCPISQQWRNNAKHRLSRDGKKCWWTKWNVSIRMVRIPLRNLTWQDLTFSNDFLLSPFNPTFGPSFFPRCVWTHFSVELAGNVKFWSSGSLIKQCAINAV